MSCTREQIVAQAKSWIGCKESNGSHKKIIDVYNSHKPKARGYTLKYTDSWCSGFVSACAIACKATDIIPTEVGCGKHITLFKNKGIWVENDAYVPMPGDILFYYWSDSGKGDCKSGASHVGIVEKVVDGKITVIEGNYSNSVKRRTLKVNGKYIRGFGVPKYDEETPKVEEPKVEETPKVEVVTIKKGDTVKVTKGARDYNGKKLASFVYSRKHKVKEVKGDRVVITYGGITVAAVRMADLTLV